MNKAITFLAAALAAFAGFSEDVRTDSAGNVYARFGSLGRNSFVATNVVEGLPLSGGDMTGPLNMGFNPITFNGSTNSSEWALWDMLRAWPTGAEGPVLLPFVITNAIAREVDGVLNGSKPFMAFNVNLPLGAGMSDPLQNFWVNGTNLHDWVQLLAPVPDLSAELGAFARTGEVFRAANWGTRDRWVDATGVVWQVGYDPPRDCWVITPEDQSQGMYVRWDGESWVFGYEGTEVDTGYGSNTYSMVINLTHSFIGYRHPGGDTTAVDRVVFAGEFSSYATNTPPLALAYGTPSRWTDATGCVWEVSVEYRDDWVADSDRITQVSWMSAGASDYPDLWVIYFTVDGTESAWYYQPQPEATQTNQYISADGWSTIYAGAFDFNIYRLPHMITNLVGRVALTNDFASVQPGDYATVSNRAMRAVQQVGDEIDVGSGGVISWGPNSSDYKLTVGDNSLATGWLFRWQWGTICLPYMEGNNVVALLSDIPSWARASSKPAYTAEEVGAVAKTGGVYSVTRYLHVSPRLSVGTFTPSVPPFDMSGGGTGNAFVFGDNIQTKAPDTVTLGVGTLNTNNYSFVWSGDANRYYMPTLPSMSNPYSTKHNGGFHVNPSVRSGMSGPLENFWIGEKNLDTWIGEKSVTPQTVTNVARAVVADVAEHGLVTDWVVSPSGDGYFQWEIVWTNGAWYGLSPTGAWPPHEMESPSGTDTNSVSLVFTELVEDVKYTATRVRIPAGESAGGGGTLDPAIYTNLATIVTNLASRPFIKQDSQGNIVVGVDDAWTNLETVVNFLKENR